MNSSKSNVPDPSSSTSSMMLSRSSSVSLESNSLRISFRVSVEMYPLPAMQYVLIEQEKIGKIVNIDFFFS